MLFLAGCRSIQPEIPEEKVTTIPQITPKESLISLPLKINLEPYFKDTEKSLPKKFQGKEEQCEDVSYEYTFYRDPIKFKGMGEYLYYEVDGKYALKLNYCPECTSLFNSKGNCIVPRIYVSCGVGEPLRKVSVGYTTKIKISPNYTFKTETQLRKFETIDPCEISLFKYDATNQLRKEVTTVLKDLEKDIDKEFASVDIKTSIKEAWNLLAASTTVPNYGFFAMQPKSVSLGKLTFQDNFAFVNLNLIVQPLFNTNPIVTPNTSLPPLSEYQHGKGFDISLDIHASYDSLSNYFTELIKDKAIKIKRNEVIFKSVEIFGANDTQLTFKVDFAGKRKGTLYLVGTPTFDAEKQYISFPDLSFDIKTKNALLKSAKWLFSDKITEIIKQKSQMELTPQFASVQQMINKEINRELTKGVFLNGKVDEIKLEHIFPNHDQLWLRVNTKGSLTLNM